MAQSGYQQGGYQPTPTPTAPIIYTTSSPTNPSYSDFSTTVSTTYSTSGPPTYSTGTYTAPIVTTNFSSGSGYSSQSSSGYVQSNGFTTQSTISQTSSPSTFSVDEKKAILDQKFQNLVKMFELNPQTADQLQILTNTKIVMLCDDSSSMGSPIAEEGTDPFALKSSTRWGELKKLAAACINIVTCINPSGLDLYFLNRPPVLGVTDTSRLAGVFQQLPSGSTPLYRALKDLYAATSSVPDSTQILLLVLTDGEPSDCSRDQFFQICCAKRRNVHLSFAELTDQADDMEWLDAFDNKIPNFDNTDDYREELQRIRQLQGPTFPFTYTHYVIKILLATFVKFYFNLDQQRVTGGFTYPSSTTTTYPQTQTGAYSNQAYSNQGYSNQAQTQCCLIQ